MRYLQLILGFLIGTVAFAQGEDTHFNRLSSDIPNCTNYNYNFMKLLPEYHMKGQFDSIAFMIADYRDKCPLPIAFNHYELLDLIDKNAFDINQYPDLMDLLMEFSSRRNDSDMFWNHNAWMAWNKVQSDYYHYLSILAASILVAEDHDLMERWILNFLSGKEDPLYQELQQGTFPNKELQKQFNRKKEEIIAQSYYHISFYLGSWLPQQNLGKLGMHPELGMNIGGYHKKFLYNFTLGYRFLPSADPYSVRIADTNHTDNYFSSIYVGLEMSRSLYRTLKHDVDVGMGLAYDGITYYHDYSSEESQSESIGTLNVNIATGYTYFYNIKNFLKLEARYHFLNYDNRIDKELSGNALSLRLIWGFYSEGNNRRAAARSLGYK